MFACAEEWQGLEVMEFEKVKDVAITILERTPQEVSRYVHERKKERDKKPQEEEPSSSGSKKGKMEVDAQEKLGVKIANYWRR